ncbi:unnamed protein product [Angiostrongylus costaricensis]|uniref:PAS domain-containing protein n=1 Tax=Angiostrongylus costaricensis TaxID=334426 RepID=A0A3P7H9Z6_ANGCS|nr:unnamed protein product [Angiostrongylus costaricensis]
MQVLEPGNRFFCCLPGKGQSIVLSAAASTTRQRIFARVNCGKTNHACELLCEFESKRARITALSLRAAYGPSAPFHSLIFTTKHAASCALTHIDYTSIPYLGHLPTDLIGRSILAFVYAPDVHIIRQAHIDLHNSRGRVVRNVAPLRFVAHNGALLRTDTEWSAYVNPWTRKIDMVVARHRILDAPIGDANVLDSPAKDHSLHVLPPAMAKTFEDELRTLMNKVGLIFLIASFSLCFPTDLTFFGIRSGRQSSHLDHLKDKIAAESAGWLQGVRSMAIKVATEQCLPKKLYFPNVFS